MAQAQVKRILVLGATGMLGHTLFGCLSRNPEYEVFGTSRRRLAGGDSSSRTLDQVSVLEPTSWRNALVSLRPDVVINCIGVVKQLEEAKNPISSIQTNSLFPHQLTKACCELGARLIHFSTDCVFSGKAGGYTETDLPDPTDLYGRTKLLGEVAYDGALTLRTSIIGHGLEPNRSLIDWFLKQEGRVSGYTHAIYSGFPTVEIARILQKVVLSDVKLSGLYHISSEPISKYDLLREVARVYGKKIEIVPDSSVAIDRSLDSTRFQRETGYEPPDWPTLVRSMHDEFAALAPQR